MTATAPKLNARGKVAVGNLPDSKSLTDREYQWIGSTGAGDILGTLIVAQGKELTTYFVDGADNDGEPGHAYILAKQHQRTRSGREAGDAIGVYKVFIGINGTRRHCSCPGFGRWGTCKHADTVAELVAKGTLPRSNCAGVPHNPVAKAVEQDPVEPTLEETLKELADVHREVFPEGGLEEFIADRQDEDGPTFAGPDDTYDDGRVCGLCGGLMAGEPGPTHERCERWELFWADSMPGDELGGES